jgi:hypothetical protein
MFAIWRTKLISSTWDPETFFVRISIMWVYDMWCEIYFICYRASKSQCKSILFSTDQNWKQTLKKKHSSYQKPSPQITYTQVINTQSTQLKYLKVKARSQNLLPKNKHSLFILNIITLILTRSTPIFFSLYLQPTTVLCSRKCLTTPLTQLQCGVFHCNARL